MMSYNALIIIVVMIFIYVVLFKSTNNMKSYNALITIVVIILIFINPDESITVSEPGISNLTLLSKSQIERD